MGLDERLNAQKGRTLSYFTLFECIPDYEVARALFDDALQWLQTHKTQRLTGPQSPSNGDDYRGLLINGFDSPPVFLDTYNPPYYQEFLERYGFEKDFDRYAYYLNLTNGLNPRLEKGARLVQEKYGLRVENLNLKRPKEEIIKLKDIIDESMPEEWPDMVPPSLEEIKAEMNKLRPLAVTDLMPIVYDRENHPIAFSVSIPDYNQLIAPIQGRLFPFGFFSLLFKRKTITGSRGFVIFVRPAWRKKGVTSLLYFHTIQAALHMGHTFLEASSIHEFNETMNREATKSGAHLYKTYRVYALDL